MGLIENVKELKDIADKINKTKIDEQVLNLLDKELTPGKSIIDQFETEINTHLLKCAHMGCYVAYIALKPEYIGEAHKCVDYVNTTYDDADLQAYYYEELIYGTGDEEPKEGVLIQLIWT